MIQFPRMAISAALVCCAAMIAGAVETGVTPDTRKEQLIRAALGAGGFSIPKDRIQRAGALYAALQEASGGPLFTFRTTGLPACSLAALDEGRRIVIDLDDMVNSLPKKTISPESPSVIQGVRTSLFAVDPRFVSRLVLDLSEPCAYRMEKQDRALRIYLSPKAGTGNTVYIDIQSDREEAPCPEAQTIDQHAVVALETHLRSASIPQTQARVEELANSLKAIQAPVSQPSLAATATADPTKVLAAELRRLQLQNPPPAVPQRETPPEITVDASRKDDMALRVARLSGSLRSVSDPILSYGLDSIWMGAAGTEEKPAEGQPLSPTEGLTPPPQPQTPPAEGQTPPAEGQTPPAEGQPTEPPAQEATPVEGEPQTAEPQEDQPQPGQEGELQEEEAPPAKRAEVPVWDEALQGNKQLYAGVPEDEAVRLWVDEPDRPKWTGDPMEQPVKLDFVDTPLANVVRILKIKAGVNIVTSVKLDKPVTVRLWGVPLRQALETALRIGDLGLIEDKGIYQIVTYAEAVRAQRITRMVKLENAKSDNLVKVLKEVVKNEPLLAVSGDPTANVVVITGPEEKVNEIVALTGELDIVKALPMVTEAIKLNHAEPADVEKTVLSMLTPPGKATSDKRARQLIVTAMPVEIEQVRELVKQLDEPVKQVAIETMVVDAVLNDSAATGVDWLMNSIQSYSRRNAALNTGRAIGNLQSLGLDANMQALQNPAGALNFALLTQDLDWRGIIQAEVQNKNGHLVSNPVMLTLENQEATITIQNRIPYIEVNQTQQGGQMTGTKFIEVGTTIAVTPRVTHDNKIIVKLDGMESGTQGEFNGIPIENRRKVTSNILMESGQTVFVGGLRKNRSDTSLKKIPILGDVPVMNFLFSTRSKTAEINDLMVFLTCEVMGENLPALTPRQQVKFDEGKNAPEKVNLPGDIINDTVHPSNMRDPAWKWRR